jgi:hypothetical protein
VSLGEERPVIRLLGDRDPRAQQLRGVVVVALEVRNERRERERDLRPEKRVTQFVCQRLGLPHPPVCLCPVPLPLVDVAEEQQRLAFDVAPA